jgi:hypothetical protein
MTPIHREEIGRVPFSATVDGRTFEGFVSRASAVDRIRYISDMQRVQAASEDERISAYPAIVDAVAAHLVSINVVFVRSGEDWPLPHCWTKTTTPATPTSTPP